MSLYAFNILVKIVEHGRWFFNVCTHDFFISPTTGKKWKKTCCVPSFVLFALTLGCLITGVALLAIFKVG